MDRELPRRTCNSELFRRQMIVIFSAYHRRTGNHPPHKQD